jgi:hypothetical protein
MGVIHIVGCGGGLVVNIGARGAVSTGIEWLFSPDVSYK